MKADKAEGVKGEKKAPAPKEVEKVDISRLDIRVGACPLLACLPACPPADAMLVSGLDIRVGACPCLPACPPAAAMLVSGLDICVGACPLSGCLPACPPAAAMLVSGLDTLIVTTKCCYCHGAHSDHKLLLLPWRS